MRFLFEYAFLKKYLLLIFILPEMTIDDEKILISRIILKIFHMQKSSANPQQTSIYTNSAKKISYKSN